MKLLLRAFPLHRPIFSWADILHLKESKEQADVILRLEPGEGIIRKPGRFPYPQLIKVPFGYIHSASKKDAAEWGLEKVKLLDELEKFNKGDYKILIGTKSISTGTNIYPTFNTVNWVGGGSEIVTKQGSMGRSTRWMKDRYKKFHKEKTQSTIWDFNVEGQHILERQLRKRIEYYEETGETVNILK